jgi:hypothetical protein
MSIRIAWLGLVLCAAMTPRTLFAGQSAQSSTELCWQSLGPIAQDEPPAIAESRLAASGASDVWLARQWSTPPLVRWLSGKWSAPDPVRAGAAVWVEAVGALPSGEVAIAGAANLENTARVLHIARLVKGEWQWLGEPLISSPQPNTHAQRASIAFARSQPVVAWSESREIFRPALFVALWNGASWTRLASPNLTSEDSFLTPAIAVDGNGQIWLAWSDEAEVRVARWSGSAWLDVGRDSLKTISAAQGRTMAREISLAAGANGQVWVLRLAGNPGQGATLAMARWDGSKWSEVATPRGIEGKQPRVWSASMILRNDAPTVAWSQAGVTDNHHLFVSEWAVGDRWNALLSGLHLVEGVSDVNDVKLASGDGRTLFVSWDEPGKDKLSTRVVRAYTCAAGETPASPPTSTVERDTWPTTVGEAARQIAAALDNESRERVRGTKKDQLIQYHHGWGTGIRNSLGLWRGNDKLLESCGNGTWVHPDSCSMVIIEAVWALLQAQK